MVFYWPQIQRQIRILGKANRVDKEKSQAYFMTRDLPSRLMVYMSNQSQPLTNEQKESFENKFKEERKKGTEINEVPENWGGFKITPLRYELWRGKNHRLHERFVYDQDGKDWKTYWLQP